MITISFYSYKGGVGRSLTLANLAVYLAQFGATVVMIDLDLEAPGLQYKVCPGSRIDIGHTSLAALLAKASTDSDLTASDFDLALDVTEHVEATLQVDDDDDVAQQRGRLLLVPAGNPLNPAYWHNLASINWSYLFADGTRPGVAAMARLQDFLVERYDPDVLLVDSRTGLTPSGGVATTLLPDVVVTLMLNSDEHFDGTRLVVGAITDSDTSASPRVVPVLSRHVAPDASTLEIHLDAEDLLDDLRMRLVAGLTQNAADKVARPLVLHSDLRLQQREQLAFGRYAIEHQPHAGVALLDDYIRLFASVVPPTTFTHFVEGMRSRVRRIVLDRPDDAIRSLDNLASLVGDEAVFVDLVKIHSLRRDLPAVLRAAERLYDVHGKVVVNPVISSALRDTLAHALRLSSAEPVPYRPDFLEDYWRAADRPEDPEWAAGLVHALAAAGATQRARRVAEYGLRVHGDAGAAAQLVRSLVRRGGKSARTAVDVAREYFDSAGGSVDFARAAAFACSIHPDTALAQRLVASDVLSVVAPAVAVDVLRAAGRDDMAGELLIETLASLEARDPTVERLATAWFNLTSRNDELRASLLRRNAGMVEFLDSIRDERTRARRGSGARRST